MGRLLDLKGTEKHILCVTSLKYLLRGEVSAGDMYLGLISISEMFKREEQDDITLGKSLSVARGNPDLTSKPLQNFISFKYVGLEKEPEKV